MSKRLSEINKCLKKLRNLSVNAKFRADQYPNDLYESGQQLFCQHTIWLRKTMRAESNIPLEKMKKLRLFLIKHCKQGGALPQNESSLCQI